MLNTDSRNTLYLYYDGECPLCRHTAQAIQIRKSLQLELIDARSRHPSVNRLINSGYDFNDGVVVEFNNKIYSKDDAVNFLALVSTASTKFNKMIIAVAQKKWLIRILYPVLKTIRRILLWWNGKNLISHTGNLPLFHSVFANNWHDLPPVFKAQYAIRSFSEDHVNAQGIMHIEFKGILRPLLLCLSSLRLFMPRGKNLSVSINFSGHKNKACLLFDRKFYIRQNKTKTFRTLVMPIRNNEVLDIMRGGLAWRAKYILRDNKIKFVHCGYMWHVLKLNIPLPISWLLGKMQGEQIEISGTKSSLHLELKHPLFGTALTYSGNFHFM